MVKFKSYLKAVPGLLQPITWVLLAYTVVIFGRMFPFYSGAGMLELGFLCFVELAVIEVLARLAMSRRPLLRFPIALLAMIVGVVYTSQIYSVWVAGGFMPPIALANSETAGFVSFKGFYFLISFFVLISTLGFIFNGRKKRAGASWKALGATCVMLLAYVPLVNGQAVANGMFVSQGESPLSSFLHSVRKYSNMSEEKRIGIAQLAEIKKEFLREEIYQKGFPEDVTASLPDHPNVIVIFTEGMSANWINAYGGVNPGLTPNIDSLANGSLVFKNYYGHTNATFRGLRGQLTSGHQEIDGYYADGHGMGQRDVSKDTLAVSRVSISDILRQHGYWSGFYISQQDYINKMLDTLGFDQVAGRDYLFDKYVRKSPEDEVPKVLSDRDLFSSMLKDLEARRGDRPLFAGLYNIQTHAFMDGEHKYDATGNEVLNRFHSYDKVVGEFVSEFMASPLHENTVLVFTADHSTFPDPHAKRADPSAQHFVDTIPLLIYWKGVEHREFDLKGKNSLDLAPSLLSLLNISHGRNMFLGCTFFEECDLDRISNAGREYFVTREDRLYTEVELPDREKGPFYTTKPRLERYKMLDMVVETAE